jgi:hypothetical protein
LLRCPQASGGGLGERACPVGGMSAHPRGRVIMNNHATRLGLAGVDGSKLEQQLRAQIAAVLGGKFTVES